MYSILLFNLLLFCLEMIHFHEELQHETLATIDEILRPTDEAASTDKRSALDQDLDN